MAKRLFRGWEALERVPAIVADRHQIKLDVARSYIENGLRDGRVGARRFAWGRVEPFETAMLAAAQIDFERGTIAEVLPVSYVEDGQPSGDNVAVSSAAEAGINAEINLLDVDAFIEAMNRVPDAGYTALKHAGGNGGRPPKFRWDEIFVETFRWMRWHGEPTPRTPLLRHLMAFCAERYDSPPDDRTLRKRISALITEIGRSYDG